ncbi:hypothetical protein TWF281_004795 [Arthrobotrys megalospora]
MRYAYSPAGSWWESGLIFLAIWPVFFQAANAAANCSASALSAKISNTTLGSPNGGRPVLFGLEMKVGGQVFVPFVNAHASDIHIKSTDKSCSGVNVDRRPLDCVPEQSDVTGEYLPRNEYMLSGFFDGSISDTYYGPDPWKKPQTNISFVGSDDIILGDSPSLGFSNHTFRSGYNTFVGPDPIDFALFNVDSWTPAYIGLNKESSILNSLYNSGKIPSRSWGFFSGWREHTTSGDPQDGSIVFGGYDAAKIDGPLAKFSMANSESATDRCQLKITINKMWIEFGPEGRTEEVSTFISKQKPDGFDVCIDPSYTAIQLPTIVRGRFMHQIQDLAQLTTLIDPRVADPTLKDLSGIGIIIDEAIRLKNMNLKFSFGGINITIPSGHLLHWMRTYTNEGLKDVENIGYPILDVIDGGPYPEGRRRETDGNPRIQLIESPILFGYPFLAAAYLFVNHESNTFSVAPVAKEVSVVPKLVPIVAPGCPGAVIDKEDPKSPGPVNPLNPDPPLTTDGVKNLPTDGVKSSPGLKPAYIAGIGVGGTLLLLTLAVVFILWRRRIRKNRAPPEPPQFERLEVDGHEVPVVRYEADGKEVPAIVEADVHEIRLPVELEGCVPVFEMDGDTSFRGSEHGGVKLEDCEKASTTSKADSNV